ncbi:hypothetical protein D3C75_790320 [compost metagenome]
MLFAHGIRYFQTCFHRHLDICYDNIRVEGFDHFLCLGAVMGNAHNLDVVLLPFQHGLQTYTYQSLVVGNEQLDHCDHILVPETIVSLL